MTSRTNWGTFGKRASAPMRPKAAAHTNTIVSAQGKRKDVAKRLPIPHSHGAMWRKREVKTMYKSPIELILGEPRTEINNEIGKVIQDVGVSVDKEELIKALAYDRQQYE